MKGSAILLTLLSCLYCCVGKHVCFMSIVATESHKFGFIPIVEALAARGHQITLVTPFAPRTSRANVREIVIPNLFASFEYDFFGWKPEHIIARTIKEWHLFEMLIQASYDGLMASAEFRQLLADRDIDLAVIDISVSQAVLPIVDSLAVPFVYFNPTLPSSSVLDAAGLQMDYASTPTEIEDYDTEMSFLQRVNNVISNEWVYYYWHLKIVPQLDAHIRRDFPNARSISQIQNDVSLVILNQHPTTVWLRPLPTNVVAIRSLHLRPAQPLPQASHWSFTLTFRRN